MNDLWMVGMFSLDARGGELVSVATVGLKTGLTGEPNRYQTEPSRS
jgi:hypothetical protein